MRTYPTMKKHNPSLPIMLREAQGTLPKVYARYEFGQEKSQSLEGRCRCRCGGQQTNKQKIILRRGDTTTGQALPGQLDCVLSARRNRNERRLID